MVKATQLRKNVKLDEYIIVPNHFHGIIILEDKGNKEDTAHRVPTSKKIRLFIFTKK